MQKRIGEMDCVVEVHDARIPLTGRNPLFDRQAKMRPHILILNKVSTNTSIVYQYLCYLFYI